MMNKNFSALPGLWKWVDSGTIHCSREEKKSIRLRNMFGGMSSVWGDTVEAFVTCKKCPYLSWKEDLVGDKNFAVPFF
jgi:hypothetical protein